MGKPRLISEKNQRDNPESFYHIVYAVAMFGERDSNSFFDYLYDNAGISMYQPYVWSLYAKKDKGILIDYALGVIDGEVNRLEERRPKVDDGEKERIDKRIDTWKKSRMQIENV